MITKDQYPPNLKDILKKYQLDPPDLPHKDLYGDLIKKNLSPNFYGEKMDGTHSIYNPSEMKPKKRIFKNTAVGKDLEAKLRAKAGKRLPVDTSGGFAVGQLVHVPNMGHGVILGFYRHEPFPYDYEGAWIDNREQLKDDGSSIRAEVLINGVFERVPLPNLSAPTEGTA